MRFPVFADVDTGVDDALALVYLLASALIGVGVDPVAFFDRFIDRVGAFAARLS